VFQKEVADIMEESIEEKRRESVSIKPSKIKQRLSTGRNNLLEEINIVNIDISEPEIVM
jgi:hypothetical protein